MYDWGRPPGNLYRAAGPSREVLWNEVQRLREENKALRAAHSRQQTYIQRVQHDMEMQRRGRGDNAAVQEVARLRNDVQRLDAELVRLRQANQRLETEKKALEAKAARPTPAPAPAPVNEDAAALKERALRLSADIANLRRNHARALSQSARAAQSVLLEEFVGILDVLEQALRGHSDPDSPWYQGSVALQRKMLTLLQKHGVTRLGDVGEKFNPRVHEAVGVAPSSDIPSDHLLEIMQPGYRFADDRPDALIRPARVIVAA